MTPKDRDRILDFTPIGMWWEITKSTADTGGEFFEAINVVNPGFEGPPLHVIQRRRKATKCSPEL